ncbi:MAG: hypothetical protein QOC76_1417 [Mycobacterium sp.]|jgi:hypothetical protein|nr:hypothetical protein [Mycobacterium sp.]
MTLDGSAAAQPLSWRHQAMTGRPVAARQCGTGLAAVNPHSSTVLGNDSRDYGEPEAGAPGIPRPTLAESYEAIEHSLSVGHGDSGTVIGDNERRRRHRRAIPTGRRGSKFRRSWTVTVSLACRRALSRRFCTTRRSPAVSPRTRTGAIPVVSIFGGPCSRASVAARHTRSSRSTGRLRGRRPASARASESRSLTRSTSRVISFSAY